MNKNKGLPQLQEEEKKLVALRKAIRDGMESGPAHDFDPKAHLESLKSKRKKHSK